MPRKPTPNIEQHCQRCGAKAGQKCRNYLGKGKATCPGRGFGREHSRRWAAKQTDKERDELGPLFADQAEGVTTDAAYWRWRAIQAENAERMARITHPALEGLAILRARAMERFAGRQGATAEELAGLRAYCEHTYPCRKTYDYGFWVDVLTGERIVYAAERGEPTEEQRAKGWRGRLVETLVFQMPNPLSRDEVYRLFPFEDQEPDNTGTTPYVGI